MYVIRNLQIYKVVYIYVFQKVNKLQEGEYILYAFAYMTAKKQFGI